MFGDPVATAAAASLLALSAAPGHARELSCTGCGKCDAGVPAPAAASSTGPLNTRCRVCRSVCSIAASKAAAAAARHLGSSAGSSEGAGANWCRTQDVLVGVSVTAAPSVALLQGLLDGSAARGPAEGHMPVRLSWSEAAGAAYGLVPLDVKGIGSGSSNLVCGWACSRAELPAGAVEASQPAAPPAAMAGGEGAGAGAHAGSGGGLIVGWQPEVWSRVAYTGELHWYSTLRLLSD